MADGTVRQAGNTTAPTVDSACQSASAQVSPWRVLFVCTANQCRSPMAEMLFTQALADKAQATSRSVVVSSAGIRALDGCPVTSQTAKQLVLRGINSASFRSRALTDAMVREADLVLTATRQHRSHVLERVPLALRRTFTLLEFAAIAGAIEEAPTRMAGSSGLAGWVRRATAFRGTAEVAECDVPDPVGGPNELIVGVADVIDAAVARIASTLVVVR